MNDALLHCVLLDGSGGGTGLTLDELLAWKPVDGVVWLHVDYGHRHADALLARVGVGEALAHALTAAESRPRMVGIDGGILLFLRGVNADPRGRPEDMGSMRLWSDTSRIISTRQRALQSDHEVREALDRGTGPKNRGELMLQIINDLGERIDAAVNDLEDAVRRCELDSDRNKFDQTRATLTATQRSAVAMHRYLAPQCRALETLRGSTDDLFDEAWQFHVSEHCDRMTRLVEDLDLVSARSLIVQAEMTQRLAEERNSRVHTLAVVSLIFLPLSFVAGVFGSSVAALPGGTQLYALAALAGGLLLVGVGILWWLRRRRWL